MGDIHALWMKPVLAQFTFNVEHVRIEGLLTNAESFPGVVGWIERFGLRTVGCPGKVCKVVFNAGQFVVLVDRQDNAF